MHTVFIHLQYLSVIGEKSVGLVLHVAELCQNGGAETFLDHGNDFLAIEVFDGGHEGFFVLKVAIAVGFIQIKGMVLDLTGIASELRKDKWAFAWCESNLPKIYVLTLDVTVLLLKPA